MNNNEELNINRVLEGSKIRDSILEALKKYIANERLYISFTIISIGTDEASKIYIRQKEKMAELIGVKCNIINLPENAKNEDVLFTIEQLNKDRSVHGIIVQLPLPEHINKLKILNSIDPIKDIDGLTNVNLGKLFNGDSGLFPATALGTMRILKEYNINVKGKDVLVINRSTLVGKALVAMLVHEDATVTIAHSQTRDLNSKLKNFDIIISAVGMKDLIKEEDVREDTILIDVGVTRVEGKIFGDMEEKLKSRNISTPSVGGIGPLTIAMLANNVVEAYKLQHKLK